MNTPRHKLNVLRRRRARRARRQRVLAAQATATIASVRVLGEGIQGWAKQFTAAFEHLVSALGTAWATIPLKSDYTLAN